MKKAVILNDTSFEHHHGCETVMENIIYLLLKRKIETIATNPVGVSWQNNFFLEQIKKADIVIVNGEGTLHHSRKRVKSLVTIGKYTKENFNIPIVLINAVYQENSLEIASYMKYFDLIFVRESYSKKDLEQHGIRSKVVPDMTFYSKYDLFNKIKTNDIGVSDSVYSNLSKKLYKFSKKHNYIFLPILSIPKTGQNIFFLASKLKQFWYKLSFLIKMSLFKFHIPLRYKDLSSLFLIDSYNNYINAIGSLKFFITGRFHSLCFALKTLTPFFAIKSNSHKIEGVLEDIGIGQNRIRTLENIQQNNIDMYIDFSLEEKEKIKNYIEQAPIKIEGMFDEIRYLLVENKK